MTVQRFKILPDGMVATEHARRRSGHKKMVESKHGPWVRYEDHVAELNLERAMRRVWRPQNRLDRVRELFGQLAMRDDLFADDHARDLRAAILAELEGVQDGGGP